MSTYDLLESDTKNDISGQTKDDYDYKNDYEELACEFVKKKYPEWIILRAEK